VQLTPISVWPSGAMNYDVWAQMRYNIVNASSVQQVEMTLGPLE
jgi:hypothetical protein